MREDSGDSNPSIRRTLDPDGANDPSVQIVEAVADIKGCDPPELTPAYKIVDHMLQELFSDPPSQDADFEVSFSYEGYRITVSQTGTAEFEPVD